MTPAPVDFCSSRRRVIRPFRGRMPRGRQIPPRPLHFPPPQHAVSGFSDVRRPERRPGLRPPQPLKLAAAGVDHAQRGDLRRLRPRLGRRMLAEGGPTTEERIRWGFRGWSAAIPMFPKSTNYRAVVASAGADCRRRRRSCGRGYRSGGPSVGFRTEFVHHSACRIGCHRSRLLNLDETITKE